MSPEFGFERNIEEITDIASRAMFRGIVFQYSPEFVADTIASADAAIERGKKGITLEGDYQEDLFVVTITAEDINMRFFTGETHSVTRESAQRLLQEIQDEAQTEI